MPFDQDFECDCSKTKHTGDNCETSDVSQGAVDSGPLVGASLGGILFLVALFSGLHQYHSHSRRNAPYEFEAMIQRLKDDGVLGSTRRMSESHGSAPTADDMDLDVDLDVFARNPLYMQGRGRINSIDLDGVVLDALAGWPSPYHPTGASTGGHIHADGSISNDQYIDAPPPRQESGVLDAVASGAVPLVRPREIAGRRLKVLQRIGGGNFGDVYSGMLDERSSTGVPSYRVAIKIPKPDTEGCVVHDVSTLYMVPFVWRVSYITVR